MLFGDYLLDIKIVLLLVIVSLVFSIFIYKFTKRLTLSIFIFSILSNTIFFLDIGSVFYRVYNLKWFIGFTLNYWPYINVVLFILLVVNGIRSRYAKEKN